MRRLSVYGFSYAVAGARDLDPSWSSSASLRRFAYGFTESCSERSKFSYVKEIRDTRSAAGEKRRRQFCLIPTPQQSMQCWIENRCKHMVSIIVARV